MKKIISVLILLALVSMVFINGCGTPSDEGTGTTDQVSSDLGVDDITDDIDTMDVDDSDFDLTGLDDSLNEDLADL